MDPIDLQIQQQIADLQQQPNFSGYQPSFVEDPMIPLPKPVVPEANVPNPVTQTLGGIKDLIVKNFNPRQTFLNYAANKALGKQGAAIFGAGVGILPFAAPMIQQAASAITGALRPDPVKQGIAGYIDQVYGTTPTGQISTGPMAGYNAISAFGSPGAINSAIKRIGTIAKARKRKESETLKQRQKDLQDYVSNVQRQMTIQKGGMGADRLTERGKPNMDIPDRNRGQTGGGGGGGASPGSQGPGGSDEMGSF